MNNLAKAKELAQRTANREDRTMLVLNLNQFSPLYVVRDFDERLLFSERLVFVAEPMKEGA
jgi:hypothetical protein